MIVLVGKTGSMYVGFHAVIGDTTYLVHPEGTAEAPQPLLELFATLATQVDLGPIHAHHVGVTLPEVDDFGDEGEVIVKPVDGLDVGFRTIIDGTLYTVDANATRNPPQKLIDAYTELLLAVGIAPGTVPQSTQPPAGETTGEARFTLETGVVQTDLPPLTDVPANWDQEPIMHVPNLIGVVPATPIQQPADVSPEAVIPNLAFGLVSQPMPVQAEQTKRRPKKAESLTLEPGEQIITG